MYSDSEMEDGPTKKTARDYMWENGGPGVWAPDYREQYDLKNPEWRFDAIPEILDGKNIMDYVDPDIDAKLAALELEEDQLAAEADAAAMGDDESDLEEEEQAAFDAIRERKKEFRMMSTLNMLFICYISLGPFLNGPSTSVHCLEPLEPKPSSVKTTSPLQSLLCSS